MDRKRILLVVIAGIIILSTLGTSIFFLRKPTDVTKTWKTFKSSKFFYEISYPSNVFVEKDTIEGFLTLVPQHIRPQGKNIGVTLSVYYPVYQKSIEEYLGDPNQQNFYQYMVEKTPTPIQMGGFPGYKLTNIYPPTPEKKLQSLIAVIKRNDIVYSLTLQSANGDLSQSDKKLFDQMSATFAFTGNPTYDLSMGYKEGVTEENQQEMEKILSPYKIAVISYDTYPPYILLPHLSYEDCLQIYEKVRLLSFVERVRECAREE